MLHVVFLYIKKIKKKKKKKKPGPMSLYLTFLCRFYNVAMLYFEFRIYPISCRFTNSVDRPYVACRFKKIAHVDMLKLEYTLFHVGLLFLLIGRMSHIHLKKWSRRHLKFRGQVLPTTVERG